MPSAQSTLSSSEERVSAEKLAKWISRTFGSLVVAGSLEVARVSSYSGSAFVP